MKDIKVIEPTIISAMTPIRVAAYCRVSTQRKKQESSLKAQIVHFTRRISETSEWELVGIYVEQESGLGTQNRSELERLFEDCQAGRIDLVLIKSISRLSRNTLNALTIFNHLFDRGIELRFDLENFSSKDKRVRQMFALIAAIAQEDSWSS